MVQGTFWNCDAPPAIFHINIRNLAHAYVVSQFLRKSLSERTYDKASLDRKSITSAMFLCSFCNFQASYFNKLHQF